MSAKDKAKQLAEKFNPFTRPDYDYQGNGKESAKQCALIAQQKEINTLTLLSVCCSKDSQWQIDSLLDDAHIIKEEIEKL